MGKADVNVNIWLSEKNRFANLFNGVIYGGENVILPEDLEEVNPVLSVNVKNRFEITGNGLQRAEGRLKKQDSR